MKTKEKDIDGKKYRVQTLPTSRGQILITKILGAILPALAKAAGGKGGTSLLDLDVGSLPEAVQLLFDRMPAHDLDTMIKELLDTATVTTGGNTMPLMAVYDDIFAGEYPTLIKVVGLAIEVNFGSFLDGKGGGLKALIAKAMAKAGQPSSLPSALESSGQSIG